MFPVSKVANSALNDILLIKTPQLFTIDYIQ